MTSDPIDPLAAATLVAASSLSGHCRPGRQAAAENVESVFTPLRTGSAPERTTFTTVHALDRAFAGERCDVVFPDGSTTPLAVADWSGEPSAADLELFVDACHGTTLDTGCGPGRLASALSARGLPALGIDISPEAIRQAQNRGATAQCRDVFDQVAGDKSWEHILLADGNVGLGGDPVRLLSHIARRMLAPSGTILVELASTPGAEIHDHVRLRVGHHTTPYFSWATVGIDAIPVLAGLCGLDVHHVRRVDERVVASLCDTTRDSASRRQRGATDGPERSSQLREHEHLGGVSVAQHESTQGRSAAGRVADALVEPLATAKPRLRGWLHACAAPLVLAAGIVLVCLAPTPASRLAAAVYTVGGVTLFTTSAVYNVGTWQSRGQAILQRLDHGSIYLIIAGTYTPIATLALDGWEQQVFIIGAWVGAGLGVIFRVLWIRAPRVLYTGLYIALGWAIAPFMGEVFAVSVAAGVLTSTGGILYTAGGVIYGIRRPDPSPDWFGFHEVFHAFTVGAWVCQYIAISILTYTHPA